MSADPFAGAYIDEQQEDPFAGAYIEEKPQQPREDWLQSVNRFLGQIPSAAITATTWPGSITTALGSAEAKEELEELEERLPRLKKLFPQAPWENFAGLDKEKYLQNVELAEKTGPTPENIISSLEETTSLPFEAKSKGQRFLKFLATSATLSPGSAAGKAHSALKAGAYSSALQAGGLSEVTSDFLGFIMGQFGFSMPKGKTPKSEKTKTEKIVDEFNDVETPEITNPEEGRLTEKPFFENLVPEHEILETIEPMLDEEFQKKIGNPPPILNLKFETKKPSIIINPKKLQNDVGKVISPTSIPNKRAAGQAAHHEISDILSNEYQDVNKLYDASKKANQNTRMQRPGMINELQDLVEEINLAPEPSSVQKDIKKIANKLINRAQSGGEIIQGRYLEPKLLDVGNDEIIAQIQSNNQKIQHDYVQGQPKNAYLRLNNILSKSIEETETLFPEAVDSYNKARTAYAAWADIAKSPEIMPWRDPSVTNFSSLIKRVENPDQLKVLEPILNRTKKGQHLYNFLVRDYVETQLNPYFQNPSKVNSIDFDKKMRDIGVVTTPKQRSKIENILYKEGDLISSHNKAKAIYEAAEASHKQELKKQESILNDWNKRVKDLTTKYPYKNLNMVLNDLESVRGLKRLEQNLPKTQEGKEMLDKIKDYAAVNLMTSGKINPSGKVEPLKKILNDVNKRSFLEHTLGKSITHDLQEIVNNVPKIDKRLSRMSQTMRMAKNIGKLVPGIKGPIATSEALYDIWKMAKPAIEKGDFSLVDMETIRMLIEHRKDLLL